MNLPASVHSPSSLADASRVDDFVHSLFHPESPAVHVESHATVGQAFRAMVSARAVERPKTPDIESDIKALLLHARRMNLLKKCVTECDAYLSEIANKPQTDASQSSVYNSTNGTFLPASPQNSLATPYSPLHGVGNSTPLPSSPDAAVYIFQGPQYRPATRAYSDVSSSFFDTEWVTPDGLVDAERLEKARLGSIPIDDLIPCRSYALASAGWRQIGDLYLDLVANVKDTALRTVFPSERDRDIIFARLAQLRTKGVKMYRIAHQVFIDKESGSLKNDEPGEPYTPVEMPKLRAPVAVPARHAGEPEPLDWLEDMAEVHQEYFRLYKRAGGPGGALRGRTIREELETVEKFYKVHCTNPRFALVL